MHWNILFMTIPAVACGGADIAFHQQPRRRREDEGVSRLRLHLRGRVASLALARRLGATSWLRIPDPSSSQAPAPWEPCLPRICRETSLRAGFIWPVPQTRVLKPPRIWMKSGKSASISHGEAAYAARPRVCKGAFDITASHLFFTVKAGRVEAAAEEFSEMAGEGDDNGRFPRTAWTFCRELPSSYRERGVVRGLVNTGAEITKPGRVNQFGALDVTLAPEPEAADDASLVRRLAEFLEPTGMRVHRKRDGKEAEWRKAAANAVINPLGATLGTQKWRVAGNALRRGARGRPGEGVAGTRRRRRHDARRSRDRSRDRPRQRPATGIPCGRI